MLGPRIFLYEGVHKLKKEMFATTHACRYLRLRFDFNYFRAKKVPPTRLLHSRLVHTLPSLDLDHHVNTLVDVGTSTWAATLVLSFDWRDVALILILSIESDGHVHVRALGPTSTRAHWLGFANWRQVFYIAPAPDGANAVCVRLLLQGLCWERQVLQEQAVPSSKWKPLPEHGGARFRFLGWQCVRARAVWCVRVHTMHIARRCQVWGSAVATILRNLRAAAARRRRGNVRSG